MTLRAPISQIGRRRVGHVLLVVELVADEVLGLADVRA